MTPYERQSSARRFWNEYSESKIAVGAFFVLCAIILTAFVGPSLTIQNPYDLAQISILDSSMPPGSESMDGKTFFLGTDDQGRDLLSAIVYGLRISLMVGVISGALAVVMGAAIGIFGAYAGGRIDNLIMRVVDLFLGFPSFLIALICLAVLGRGADKVVLALVLSQWANFARIVRGVAIVEREKEYMDAARGLALPKYRIVFGHLLPNCLPPLIVVSTMNVAFSITLEASLSFLGVGLPITEPSLGLLISNGYEYILTGKQWMSFYPGVALLITVASINLVADRMRDVFNPRLKK
ncbi:MAG: ABC transporter permease [Albidovulum sp.]|nr:ABC transporter permease [Albidovulum sp.]